MSPIRKYKNRDHKLKIRIANVNFTVMLATVADFSENLFENAVTEICILPSLPRKKRYNNPSTIPANRRPLHGTVSLWTVQQAETVETRNK